MNVVVIIAGREAIPVRSIPYVTGRWMSPDVVARSLAGTDFMKSFNGVSAYQLLANGNYAPILPKEWDAVDDLLRGLEAELEGMGKDRTVTRPIWLAKSTSLLPAGVFLWRDEFERTFSSAYSPQRYTSLDERPGDRELNYMPLISPPEVCKEVLEGFESVALPSSAGSEKRTLDVAIKQPDDATLGMSRELKQLPQSSISDWQTTARTIADELHEKDKLAGAHSSITDIADRVAVELRARGIHGTRAAPLAGTTVLREALQGKKWKRKQ